MTAPVAGGDLFTFNWTGRPTAPQPWQAQGWDLIVHSRDERTWQTLDPMPAQHGADCGAPPAVHAVSSYEDAVFICNNHMMTAFLPGGYGEIEMAPDRLLDWSSGTAVVSWHQSTYRTSPRDWTDINVTPFADNLVLPANVTVDLSGEPRNGIQVAMSTAFPTTFDGNLFSDFNATHLAGASLALERVLPPSMTVRAHFQLEISRSHIRFGLPDQNVWFIDQDVPEMSFTSGVVQLGHHSYTPDKECTPPPDTLACTGDTWHWSDFSMGPARQFTLLKGDAGGHISRDTPDTVNFGYAAPANSFIRFAAVGAIGVSFDGGKTWKEPVVQPATRNRAGSFRGDLFNSYWTPVPEGTSSITFSGQDTYFSPWWVKDAAIWSMSDPSGLQKASPVRPTPVPVPAKPAVSPGPATSLLPAGVPPQFRNLARRLRHYYVLVFPAGDGYQIFVAASGAGFLGLIWFGWARSRRRPATNHIGTRKKPS